MAALIGYLKGTRGEVSRLGSKDSGIRARLETWDGAVTVNLAADGTYTVYAANSKHATGDVVAHGKVGS